MGTLTLELELLLSCEGNLFVYDLCRQIDKSKHQIFYLDYFFTAANGPNLLSI
jgi:hypothetical protein